MFKKIAFLSCFCLLPVLAQAGDAVPATPVATSPTATPELQDKFSYAIGRDIAKGVLPVRDFVNAELLKQGIDDAFAGKAGNYTEDELGAAKAEMSQVIQAHMQAAQIALAESNQKAADAFLKKNGKRKGVVPTSSGLLYEVMTAAKGAHPKATSYVTVHYRGTLEDGTEFDSSYGRGTPVSFSLDQVIPGWTEGVQLMAKGAKYKFYVPSSLAYSDRGAGDRIGPNAMLIFEVELIDFSDAPPVQDALPAQ